MIRKKSIALVLDTNILIKILSKYDSENLISSIKIWAGDIIKKIDSNMDGKSITLFVTTNIIKDYKAGLNKSKNEKFTKKIKENFERSMISRHSIHKSGKTYLVFRKVSINKTLKKIRLKDKGDEKFLDLIEAILGNKKWCDRALIVATRDHSTYDGIRDHLKDKRIHLSDSLKTLEKNIEC